MRSFVLAAFIFLTACGAPSREQLRRQGHQRAMELAYILQGITTCDGLAADAARVKRGFNRLAETIVQAEFYRRAHPQEGLAEEAGASESDFLEYELKRLYSMPGCAVLLEGLQNEAYERCYLDLCNP